MYFRNVWSAAELTNACRPVLLQQYRCSVANVRVQIRKSLHNSRRGGRDNDPNPLEHLKIDCRPLHPNALVKPFFFTVGVSTLSLGACMIWEYEALRSHATSFFRKSGAWLSTQQRRLKSRSEPGPVKKWWNSLRESEKVFYPILAANVLVFGAWRMRQLQPFMIKYFCSNPSGSAKCLPMLLSTFSHYSAMHLAANMYVLYSFMPAAVASLGKEQFTAMYLSAGVISSFASFVYKVLLNQPGLSLGASGAIMSVLAYVCVQYPDTRLSIIFLPMYTFAAGTAIKVIMSVDLAGVVFGWKFFDHAAHLGGALFGMYWCRWGSDTIWGNRDKFLQYYHTIRKNDSNR
ncbi:rhomboid family intramembrane serine protease rho-7 [Anticarsia gemmatalis]|uniref:rhomboid family intramembrane serine protease rho-7 n=1 Tax=Anticarsia gemmatalis TaxID=129554 RepID=UPI003F764862